jgi:capsid protein
MNRILGGVTAVLQPNEELVAHQPARPTTAFTGFIEHLRRDSCLGSLPFEFLADPTKAGGASVRLVVAKAGRYFSHRQNIIIKRFLNPYFQYWLGTKINRGDLPSARNWWKVEWMTPRSVTVDAGRDAVSDRADLEMGRTTIEDDFAARGYQYEKTMRKRAKNFLFLEKLAKDTGLNRDDLFRFSPQGGMEGAAGNKQQVDKDGNPIPDESGKNPLIEDGLDYEDIKDTVGELEPETTQPDVGTGVTPIVRNETPVDSIPKQNIGRSRPVDQSFVG